MWRTALLALREQVCSPELREAEQEQLGESETFTNEAHGDIPAFAQRLVLLRRMQASGQEGSRIRSSTQLVPRCLPVLEVLLHWGVFRARRSRWWERGTCFTGMWIAEFAALERITQYFACGVQNQQTSQGLNLLWFGLRSRERATGLGSTLVPPTGGSAGETAFMANASCWAADWPPWPLCSEIPQIPV